MGDFDLLARYQTGLVGLLGFAGVIVTLWWNASLSARAQRRAVKSEIASLRAALLAELTLSRAFLALTADQLDQLEDENAETEDKQPALVQPFEPPEVYTALVSKIGLLSPEDATKIVRGYQFLKRARRGAASFGTVKGDYVEVPPEHVVDARSYYEDAMIGMEVAIRALGGDIEDPTDLVYGTKDYFRRSLFERIKSAFNRRLEVARLKLGL